VNAQPGRAGHHPKWQAGRGRPGGWSSAKQAGQPAPQPAGILFCAKARFEEGCEPALDVSTGLPGREVNEVAAAEFDVTCQLLPSNLGGVEIYFGNSLRWTANPPAR
jgi:hypothetical protein